MDGEPESPLEDKGDTPGDKMGGEGGEATDEKDRATDEEDGATDEDDGPTDEEGATNEEDEVTNEESKNDEETGRPTPRDPSQYWSAFRKSFEHMEGTGYESDSDWHKAAIKLVDEHYAKLQSMLKG